MGEIRFRVEGWVPREVVEAFNEFMREESIKCERMVQRDLKKWLKPLPESYRDAFKFSVIKET